MVSGLIQIVVILLSGAGFDFTGSLVGFSGFDYWSFGEGWLIVAVQRVHEELVGAVRLCAPLWLKSVKKDMPFAVGHIEGGSSGPRFSLDVQPAPRFSSGLVPLG